MIYGMDDNEELGLVETKQLNIKKVVIIVAIIVVVILLFLVTVFSNNNGEDLAVKTAEDENVVVENPQDYINEEIDISNKEDINIEEKQDNIEGEDKKFFIPIHDFKAVAAEYLPVYNENARKIIKEIYTSDEKQVYLTFDDGPTQAVTPQILDILRDNDVKATFFVLGFRVELNPDILKRAYNEGHYIANHGYSHEYSKIYESKDTVFQEYVECENSIKNALGNPDFNTYLFRFPGGSSGGRYSDVKAEARQWFDANGVAYTNWNCLTGDAENKKTKDACIQELIKTKANQNSLIVLMHDAADKQQTIDALPDIINYFKQEGYVFKTFYDIFK